MRYIQDFKEGDRIADIYMCKHKQSAVTKNGKPYENVILQDKTGTMDAKVWDPNNPGIDEYDVMDYIEVVGDEKTEPVYFEVDTAKWTALTDATGPNGGKLYYKALGASDKADEILVEILKKLDNDRQVRVSETLPRDAELDVSFYAYIGKNLTNDPAADFTTQFMVTEGGN